MSQLLFYQQTRRDGGMRMGVELDGYPVLERFDEGNTESDPLLRWFIDVSFEGNGLPKEAAAMRDWLLSRKPLIVEALVTLAAELNTGADTDVRPIRRDFPAKFPATKMRVTCSAGRRTDARHLGSHVRQLARRWTTVIRNLREMQKANR